MRQLTILAGTDKNGESENLAPLILHSGEVYSIIGDTGSGKSRLIKDIEQMVDGDSPTGRKILLDDQAVNIEGRNRVSSELVAHLSQNMRFILDINVQAFILLHAKCRKRDVGDGGAVIDLANSITREPIKAEDNLNMLSGGQTRALMIADIACICRSPVVLIDEIENGGIDKLAALEVLISRDKLVLMVTHDPQLALSAKKRIVMGNGAIQAVLERSTAEEVLLIKLAEQYRQQLGWQQTLRKGEWVK